MSKRVCVVGLGGGGFQGESEAILESISEPLELVLIFSGPNGGIINWSCEKHMIKSAYKVRSPSLMGDSKLGKLLNIYHNFVLAYRIIMVEDVDIILGVGTVQFIPFSIIGKLKGRKTVFVETVARITYPSLTGRLVNFFKIADCVYYYWSPIGDYYKSGIALN